MNGTQDQEYFDKLKDYYIRFLELSPGYNEAIQGEATLSTEEKIAQFRDYKDAAAGENPAITLGELETWKGNRNTVKSVPLVEKKYGGIGWFEDPNEPSVIFIGIDLESTDQETINRLSDIVKLAKDKYWEKVNGIGEFGEPRGFFQHLHKIDSRKQTSRFAKWDQYLECYKLFHHHKKKYREIHSLVFPKEEKRCGNDIESFIRKQVRAAERLIQAAVEGRFPPA